MKLLIYSYLMLGTLVFGADYTVAEDVARLKGVIGSDWTITSTPTSIQIESTFDVWFVPMVSRMFYPPEFRNSVTREQLDAECKSQHYIIQIKYGPLLSRDDFETRVAERKRYSDVLTYGVSGPHAKEESEEAVRKFEKIRVPRYRDWSLKYSIDRVLPERVGCQIYPPSAVAKIGGLKELLDVLFWLHINPYE